MADERLTLAGINWRETFAFTHLFRTFRIAIHPSKLILGLLLLLSLYAGGRLLDALWPSQHLAVPGEVSQYERRLFSEDATALGTAGERVANWRETQIRRYHDDYADLLSKYNVEQDRKAALEAAQAGKRYDELEDAVRAELQARRTEADERLKQDLEAADQRDGEEEDIAEASAHDAHRRRVADLHDTAYADLQQAKRIFNQGIFTTFFTYQTSQFDGVVRNVLNWNWLGDTGVVGNIRNFLVVGPSWLLTQHPLYFFLFLILFLVAWGIFGGAIARIAAVHAARDEKLSVRQALRFSMVKLLSFVFAPIIPLLIVVGIGLIVFLGALVGNIPFLGPILIGLLFFLMLAAGFVMTLVLLGLIGGFNLMYPTIAIEGSDSFDAISRSFSYVYARPWKMALYTLIALVYGVLCYLFVRFFIYLLLVTTHRFVDCGMLLNADNGRDLFSTMWPGPESFWKLSYDIDFLAMGVGSDIGASLVAFWVYLVIGMLGAFAISFYFSANTIIYYLMRREVDATELDDVYVEQLDEEFTETPPAPAESGASGAASGGAASGGAAAGATATAGGAAAGAGTTVPPPTEPPPPASAATPSAQVYPATGDVPPSAQATSAPGESPATEPRPEPQSAPERQDAPQSTDSSEPQQGGLEGGTGSSDSGTGSTDSGTGDAEERRDDDRPSQS